MREEAVDALSHAIVHGDIAAIREPFLQAGRFPPTVFWEPTAADVAHPELRFLLVYWNALRGDQDLPRHTQIDPLDMQDALGFIMLLDVMDDGRDFRYRLYGSKVADRSRIDMTGKLLSEFEIAPLTRGFFIAGYRAVINRRLPLLTEHHHTPDIAITSTTRLVLPLADGGGAVSRMLVGNMPGDWRTTN